LWANFDGIKNKTNPLWFEVTDAVSSVCLIIAALSYWLPFHLPPPLIFSLFVVGVLIFVWHAVVTGRKHVDDAELSFQGKLFVVISGNILGLLMSAPILYWGFNATVLSSYADT
jgi:hypothetical protein